VKKHAKANVSYSFVLPLLGLGLYRSFGSEGIFLSWCPPQYASRWLED